MADSKQIVGDGPKKVLYTLATISRMGGGGKVAKALTAKNACKACAYGMGGRRGGMINELGELPSVCNKSVQAQSTDIQPAIPTPIFENTIDDLTELTGREMEQLDRLGTPLFKAQGANRFTPVDWAFALDHAAQKLAATDPQRGFFCSSGRSSNEAGFIFQFLARAYGADDVNNCSYYFRRATSEGLASTIGKATSSVELEDLTGADLIFVIGSNPASNHPRFIHMLKGGSEIASDYCQPRIGINISLFKGIVKAVQKLGLENTDFTAAHASGFEAFSADLDALSWETITTVCGIARAKITHLARQYGRAQNAVFAWGMGMTHHLHGVANVEAIANLASLRGMVGKRFAGLLPLRGHSNFQGIGTIGVKPVLAKDVLDRMKTVFGVSFPAAKSMNTMACLKTAEAGGIDSAVIMGGNLWNATPDTGFASRAMVAIGFKLFLTTTLNKGYVHGLGDGEVLILPVTARDEEWESAAQESMFNYARLNDGGISRLENARPESWILGELGQRVLPDGPIGFKAFSVHARVRDAIAAIVPGLEELADIGVAKQEFHFRRRVMRAPEFGTADGRAHFVVTPMPATSTVPLRLATVRSEGSSTPSSMRK
ncbi:MAG: molybdopterin-dependent oxidoreductase, partial [Candidatus Devosia euplotis]|nr:molybdopterin-dependent oxidoreductase [Candidatus Devosia euplotis]